MKTNFIADETSVFKEILITLQLHYMFLFRIMLFRPDFVFHTRIEILFGSILKTVYSLGSKFFLYIQMIFANIFNVSNDFCEYL